jgi:predicted DNA-binding transcriptional regulator AlpA
MSSQQTPARADGAFRAPDASLTIDEFCKAEKISRSMLYRAWSEGWGPRFYRIGVTRRITYRARLEWQREREAAAAAAEAEGAET